MRRIGGVWQEVISPGSLEEAFLSARRGKRSRDEVALFSVHWERELQRLAGELRDRSYVPGGYRQFHVYDRKPRLISAAPFRDRIVHHALMSVLEPHLDRRFYAHSYACRPGKGVHAAVDYYQSWASRYAYVLKLDIMSYFPSVDRQILLQEIRRYVKDEGCLWLFDLIINSAPVTPASNAVLFPGDDFVATLERPRGLPIGNLTSQILANLLLNRVDHQIVDRHRAPYLRYVDDLALLGNDKDQLWEMYVQIGEWLASLRLRLHPNKAHVMRTDRKVDMLGYQVSRGGRWLRGENVHRTGRRLRAMERGLKSDTLTKEAVDQSVAAWKGHLSHAGAWGLCRKLMRSVSLLSRSPSRASGPARSREPVAGPVDGGPVSPIESIYPFNWYAPRGGSILSRRYKSKSAGKAV